MAALRILFNIILLIIFLVTSHSLELGIVSYWYGDTDFKSIPDNCLCIINPDSGIIDDTSADIQHYAKEIGFIQSDSTGVKILGYVPTGFGDRSKRSYDQIKQQVQLYYKSYPTLNGIFFDEMDTIDNGYSCSKAKADMVNLTDIVNGVKSKQTIAFNPGTTGTSSCYYVSIASSGQIVMDFEGDKGHYVSSSTDLKASSTAAKSRGVKTWHCIYGVTTDSDMKTYVKQANVFGADYVYVTDYKNYTNPPHGYWSGEINYVPTV